MRASTYDTVLYFPQSTISNIPLTSRQERVRRLRLRLQVHRVREHRRVLPLQVQGGVRAQPGVQARRRSGTRGGRSAR